MSRTALALEPLGTGRRSGVAIVIALSVLAVTLVGFALLFLAGPPEAPVTAALPPTTPVVDDSQDGDDEESPTATQAVTPVVTYDVFLSRDPFEPVVPEEEPASVTDPAGPGDPAAPTEPSDPSQPSDPADPSDPSNGGGTQPVSPSDPDCRSGAEVVCEGRVLTAIDIFRDGDDYVAVIQVDTTIFEVRRGQQFSTDPAFRVVDLTATSVTLQVGDDAFVLRTGDTVLK